VVSIPAAWITIERVLQEHLPVLVRALRRPATDKQIAALEQFIGRRLPDDFVESLPIHNGIKDSYLGPNRLFNNEALLSTHDITAAWRIMKELLEDCPDFQESGDPRTRSRRIKNRQWWYPGWVPITDNEGDGYILDLDPAARGRIGQVFYFYHDGSRPREVVARSFGAWLDQLAKRLAGRKSRIEYACFWIDLD
jgi:cell wall assembly regulator SMI1